MQTAPAFQPRRIGVCGSSRGLPPQAVEVCRALGRALAAREEVILVTGGTRRRLRAPPGDLAVDWHVATAASEVLPRAAWRDRIVTLENPEPGSAEAFSLGGPESPTGRTQEARRFSFVRKADALIAVAGMSGTGQELALAAELGIPVLPVPCFGGAAQLHWKAYRDRLVHWFGIDEATACAWEDPGADPSRVTHAMLERFFERLPWRCFVVMPYGLAHATLFDRLIEPAVLAAGDRPLRLDRAGAPGDVVAQIRDNLAGCDYAVVVLDGLRLNVLYELGYAHGSGKPTLLLNRARSLRIARIPFDIAGQQRIEYETLDDALAQRLQTAIARLKGWPAVSGR